MKQVKVKLVGVAPLLMNRFKMEENLDDKVERRDRQYDSKTDAENALYKNKMGCYVPSSWVEAALRKAGAEFKGKGKASLKKIVLSSVFVEKDEIPLNKETYDEIDRRPAVIQKHRIVKSRPKFNTWEIEFSLNYDESRLNRTQLLELLKEAGQIKGIGDYRPKFGRFRVEEFTEVSLDN